MKTIYQKPITNITNIKMKRQILAGSLSFTGNTGTVSVSDTEYDSEEGGILSRGSSWDEE